MIMKKYILLFIVTTIFTNCKKEDKILKKIVGTWTVNEIKRAGGYLKNDFSDAKTTFEFIQYDKAYTATMKAVYRVDYADASKVDMVDTFKFQMKGDELDIIAIQKSANIKFLRNRFTIKEYKDNKLHLSRIDSTDLYIKATK